MSAGGLPDALPDAVGIAGDLKLMCRTLPAQTTPEHLVKQNSVYREEKRGDDLGVDSDQG